MRQLLNGVMLNNTITAIAGIICPGDIIIVEFMHGGRGIIGASIGFCPMFSPPGNRRQLDAIILIPFVWDGRV